MADWQAVGYCHWMDTPRAVIHAVGQVLFSQSHLSNVSKLLSWNQTTVQWVRQFVCLAPCNLPHAACLSDAWGLERFVCEERQGGLGCEVPRGVNGGLGQYYHYKHKLHVNVPILVAGPPCSLKSSGNAMQFSQARKFRRDRSGPKALVHE